MGRNEFDMDCTRSPRFTSPALLSGAAGCKVPGPQGLAEEIELPPGKRKARQVMLITASELKKVMPRLSGGKVKFPAETLVGPLNVAMKESKVMTHGGAYCAFLAQIAHESSQLTAWDETGTVNIAKYEPVLPVDLEAFKQIIAATKLKIDEAKTKVIQDMQAAAQVAKTPYKAPTDQELLTKARSLVPPDELKTHDLYKSRLYNTKGQGHGVGNEKLGDGKLFAGRGPIQLTGRYNYTEASKKLGLGNQLVTNPELVANDVEIGTRTTYWYWTKSKAIPQAAEKLRGYVFPNDPTELVAKEKMIFARITRLINGTPAPGKSANGEDDRWNYYKTMVETFWYPKDMGDYGGSTSDPWGMGVGVMPA